MQILAPAKINLNLRVLGRNETTGFHDIETWMAPLSLADELRVEPDDKPGIKLVCSDPQLDNGAGNLAWRAADLFFRQTGHAGGAAIELRKNTPHGAGLGGGSSDAAAVLLALNDAAGRPLDTAALEKLASQIGSDVAFFIRGIAAMARGRGEILEPRPLHTALDLLLIKPPFPVETAWAYGQWQSANKVPEEWVAPQLHDGIEIFNDLERPVFAKFITLAAMKLWLLEHSLVAAAGMSGSGSCMFAILRDPRGAAQLAADALAEFGTTYWTCACRTVDAGQVLGD
ncbi:MAG: 4-(cytidine 5'-diphospho)-2-C-methyl-D-erythritol kinase [Chthoniobacterales bacterium]|nr:4-(cytidine 5'-diphospho)-2-C-methyl-D-erythritol kinase [Chthoniobacterales bacterium]